MGKTNANIDNDIVIKEEKSNDIDNVRIVGSSLRKEVLNEITEYKLGIIQSFMFGGSCKYFGDCTVFINPAIKQIERFAYIWFKELSEEARKIIIGFYIHSDEDDRKRDYKDYVNSPIWKYSSSIIKLINDYTCAGCKKQYNPAHLVVHHKSYEHIGSELFHLDEMDVLCTDCHMKIHGVERTGK